MKGWRSLRLKIISQVKATWPLCIMSGTTATGFCTVLASAQQQGTGEGVGG